MTDSEANDEAEWRRRALRLEAALLRYVEKYGLLPEARAALSTPPPSNGLTPSDGCTDAQEQ